MRHEIDFHKIQSKLFCNLLPKEQISQKYSCLGQKKQELFHGIYDRWSYVNFIEENYMNIIKIQNPKFVRSLQGYLLLSCSDALGSGANFYSFENFLNEKDNPERDILINRNLDKGIKDHYQLKQFVKNLWDYFRQRQNIKQSFLSFWSDRSSTIKEKLFYCYTPLHVNQENLIYDDQVFLHTIVRKRLYENYRNPFTHNARNNFPQLMPDLTNYPETNLGKAVSHPEYHQADGKIFPIKVPLTTHEAEKILSIEGTLYYRLIDNSLLPFLKLNNPIQKLNDPRDLVYISIVSRGMAPEKNHDGQLTYVHAGTLDVLTMAIAEASAKVLGLPIAWNALYV